MTRHAIYFMPEPGTPLARFGMRAIGYDADSGVDVAFHEHPFFRHPEIAAWTESPRRYGFHATLKAPFELAPGKTREDLLTAAQSFAAGRAVVELGNLRVRAIGSFVALTVKESSGAVDVLAADCVRAFEPFRAPPSAADLERRLSANLSEDQRANVDAWGYPYVFDAFRFHMTLTGRLRGRETVKRAVTALSEIYAAIDAPVAISHVTVAEQASRESRFRMIGRFPTSGG